MSEWDDIQSRIRTARRNVTEVIDSLHRIFPAGLDGSTWTDKLLIADGLMTQCQDIIPRLELEMRKLTNVKYPMIKGEITEDELEVIEK